MDVTGVGARRIVAGLAVLAAVGLAAGYGVSARSRPEPVRLEAATPEPESTDETVFVHVAGAVAAPGVYRFAGGARVDDAVRAAGGVTDDADLDGVNLAARLNDGDKVTIPVRGAPGDGGGSGSADDGGGRVNLNAATATELQALPGIGPSLAERIVAHREQRGPFRTVKDLLKVSGIGPKKFEGLEDLVTV